MIFLQNDVDKLNSVIDGFIEDLCYVVGRLWVAYIKIELEPVLNKRGDKCSNFLHWE